MLQAGLVLGTQFVTFHLSLNKEWKTNWKLRYTTQYTWGRFEAILRALAAICWWFSVNFGFEGGYFMRIKVKVIFPPSSPCLHINTSCYYILVVLVLLCVFLNQVVFLPLSLWNGDPRGFGLTNLSIHVHSRDYSSAIRMLKTFKVFGFRYLSAFMGILYKYSIFSRWYSFGPILTVPYVKTCNFWIKNKVLLYTIVRVSSHQILRSSLIWCEKIQKIMNGSIFSFDPKIAQSFRRDYQNGRKGVYG